MLTTAFKKKVFIPYVTAGDPDFNLTLEILVTLAKEGAGIIEIGIPFSDPVADGKINQASFQRALKSGFHLEAMFEMLTQFRELGYNTSIVLFGYLNPFLQFGLEKLAQYCLSLKVEGILILDLPFEYSSIIQKMFKEYGVDLIYLVTPTTDSNRLDEISKKASGFIYCVARTGVTGKETIIDSKVQDYLSRVKGKFKIPIAVGFGVSESKQVEEISKYSDAVVVGSFLIKKIEDNLENPQRIIEEFKNNTNKFVKALERFPC